MNNTRQIVMDIAMNLNRIGSWIADDFEKNNKKVQIFITNTDGYIANVDKISDKFKPTWQNFMEVYPVMKNNPRNNAENLMTWGNILTHRAKFIEE